MKAAKSRQIVPNDCERAVWEDEAERSAASTKPTPLTVAGHRAALVEINLTDSMRWYSDSASAIIECLQFSSAFLAEGPQRIDGVAARQSA